MGFLSYMNETTSLLTESVNDAGRFKAIFMAGTAGSGKSYILTKIKSGTVEPRIVNVDKFTEFLDIENIPAVYDRSKIISKNQLVQYFNGILPLFIDTTAANPNRLRARLNVLDEIGYDYAMIFVNTSLDTALQRANNRQRKVDQSVIVDYHKKLQKLKNDVKGYFNFNMEINNDDNELTDDVIKKAFKRISYFYDAPIENPIGVERYDKMLVNGWKYLSPNIMDIEDIKRIASTWYGK